MVTLQHDPSGDEEKNKYDYPIPSREAILEVLVGKPLSLSDVVKALGSPKWSEEPLKKRLGAMCRDRQLTLDNNHYRHKEASRLVKTAIIASKSGHLAIQVEGVMLFLSYRHAQGLFPNDRAIVRLPKVLRVDSVPVIVKIVESEKRYIACLFTTVRGKSKLIPFDRRVKKTLVFRDYQGIPKDSVVWVKRSKEQTSHRALQVDLIKVLGNVRDPGVERKIAQSLFALGSPWPSDYSIPNASQEYIDNLADSRTDWRDLPLVTIDGEDAKDFDDAVYAKKMTFGYRLYVAIADVAHYVKEGTDLDEEAKDRGNSVYLPGYVFPMLPEVLSNGLCSLRPEVNRLAMGCVIDIGHDGQVLDKKVEQVVIRSHARLTYTQVDQMLAGEIEIPPFFITPLKDLDQTAKTLRSYRQAAGTVILRSRETVFSFKEDGHLRAVEEVTRGWSNSVIEECMLCANLAVGKLMHEKNMPLIYRSHQAPDFEKVERLQEYIKAFGLTIPNDPSPKDLQMILDACADKPDFPATEMMILRTLSQAYYSQSDASHYALSMDYYTHFTSPIRRYVDLTVHRSIVAMLEGRAYEADLESVANDCSQSERRADEAGWFAQAWLKSCWMEKHIGEIFQAKITSVTSFGMFIQLDNQPVEGLVHISSLGGEYFNFDNDTMTLVGSSTGKCYQLGAAVKVELKSVDISLQRIDFILAE